MNKRILKITKWFFGIVLGVCLLITGALYFFKDDICGYVVGEVNKHLKAKVTVSEVDLTFWATFPNVSVDFNDVFIQDSYANSTKRDTLLFSEQIRLKFNPIDIWNEDYKVKSIEVNPGTVQLKVRKNGEVNYDILQESKDAGETKFELNLQNVVLNQIRFAYKNKATNQYYKAKLAELELTGNFTDKKYTLHAKSALKVNKLKSGKVTLISNQPAKFEIDIKVDNVSGVFEIPNAEVFVAELPFQVKGAVSPEDLNFEIHSKNIQLADLANRFSFSQVEDVKKFDGTGNVYFDLFIDGKNETTSPTEINCDFGVNNGSLTEPVKNLKIQGINLKGKYSNIGGTEKEFLKLSSIKFKTPGGPFSGNLLLTQFQEPNFRGNANGNLNLNMLHSLFRIPHVENINGNLGLQTVFNIQSVVHPDASLTYSVLKCEGDVQMKNVVLKLMDDKRTFRQMNGAMYLRNDEAGIENVSLKIGTTDLAFNGVFKNIINYFKKDGNLTANVEVKSKFIDVQDLGTTSKEEKIQEARSFVLPSNIDGSLFMDVAQIEYDKHTFKKLSGNMLLGKRKLHFPNLTLRNADADMVGSLTIEERSEEVFHITTTVSSDNIKFKSLFREWNNFHQEVIGENNVFGKAQAKVYFEAPFDLRGGVISKSIKSQVYLKITDGQLKNVDAFKSITESLKTSSAKLVIGKSNIAYLENKLLDLKFETLENTFVIQNGKLEIPAMLIHTNALDIETSGTHTFDNIIDYRFAFRFRDLKEKNTQSEFGVEEDDGTGVKIFMRMSGDIDNPTIIWDKTAKKEQAKENREAEKENVKSILKAEFGLFKNDTTVKTFIQKEGSKETLQLDFGPAKTEDPIDTKKPKKDSKIKNTLKGWKEEADKSKKEEIDLN